MTAEAPDHSQREEKERDSGKREREEGEMFAPRSKQADKRSIPLANQPLGDGLPDPHERNQCHVQTRLIFGQRKNAIKARHHSTSLRR